VGEENTSVITSPTLNPTTSGGGLDAVADTRPGQHCAAPSLLLSNGAHAAQVDAFTAARLWLYLPAAQGMHASREVVPVTLL
jgi:hypothetical protein